MDLWQALQACLSYPNPLQVWFPIPLRLESEKTHFPDFLATGVNHVAQVPLVSLGGSNKLWDAKCWHRWQAQW